MIFTSIPNVAYISLKTTKESHLIFYSIPSTPVKEAFMTDQEQTVKIDGWTRDSYKTK